MLTVLSNGDQDTGSCPACGTLMRAADVHSAAALVATSKVKLPPEMQAAVREVSDQKSASQKLKRSSKIQRLMEVRMRYTSGLADVACGADYYYIQ